MHRTFAERVSGVAYGAALRLRNLGLVLLAVAMLAGTAAAEVRILAFGDSLIHGYGLPEGEGFVPRLQAWLRRNGAPDAVVINAGVSGDTTAGGRNRIGWSLTDDVDAVVVTLGGNDMLRGFDVGPIRENLDAILTEIGRRDLPVMLCGIPAPANYGEAYRREFAAIFRDLAREHRAIYCPSFFAGITDGRSRGEMIRLMQPDGIHPNGPGVEAIVEAVGPAVLDLISVARAG